MRSTASLIILAFLALLVSDARAQEQSISLNIDGVSGQLQRTPALIIHEVVAPTVTVKTAPAAALKTQGAPKKDAASKSSAAGAPSAARGAALSRGSTPAAAGARHSSIRG